MKESALSNVGGLIETVINYYTGQDVSHLSDDALIMKFLQVQHIREQEAQEGNSNSLNI